jgi:hypothetical protein
MAMAHTSRAAVAAIACLLMLIGTAPSAAQFSTPGGTPNPGAATGNTTSAITSTKAVHTVSVTPEIIKSAQRQERALELTPEQAAALVQRAAGSPAPEAASADGASYAPRRGAAVPVPVGQVGLGGYCP